VLIYKNLFTNNFQMKHLFALQLAAIVLLTTMTSAMDTIIWELENYNNWNLPFAKTVEIVGVDMEGGTHPHILARNSYVLEVDATAIFSILFLDSDSFPPSRYEESDLRTLNYTVMGKPALITELTGVWVDVQIYIRHGTLSSNTYYTAEFTIFVAITNTPPNHGLNGILSVCVTPQSGDWLQSSLILALQEKYLLPNIYVSFRFLEQDGFYLG
jgi:hypothetical protein